MTTKCLTVGTMTHATLQKNMKINVCLAQNCTDQTTPNSRDNGPAVTTTYTRARDYLWRPFWFGECRKQEQTCKTFFLSAILYSSLRQHLIPKNPLIMEPRTTVGGFCLSGGAHGKQDTDSIVKHTSEQWSGSTVNVFELCVSKGWLGNVMQKVRVNTAHCHYSKTPIN